MKKKIGILLLITLFIFTKGLTVLADTAPHNYEHDGYSFTIDGFYLAVYQMDKEENEEGELELTDESWLKYLKGQYIKEIALEPDEVTFSLTYHPEQVINVRTTMINLDVNISEETLKTLLAEELSSATEQNFYYVELAVNYIIKGIPEKYTKISTQNVFKDTYLVSLGESIEDDDHKIQKRESSLELNGMKLEEVGRTDVNLDEVYSQVISGFSIKNGTDINYTKDVEEVDVEDLFSYIHFSSEDDEVDGTIMLFTNVDDTNALANKITTHLREMQLYEEDPITGTTDTTQTVQVGDTAMDVPIGYFAGGILLILLGAGVVFYVVIKKSSKKQENE